MRVLGITDEVTTCDNCGKKGLKCTVALDNEGAVVHFGRDCAGAALYGKKNAKNTDLAEREARRVQRYHRYIAAGYSKADAAAFTGGAWVAKNGAVMMQVMRGKQIVDMVIAA